MTNLTKRDMRVSQKLVSPSDMLKTLELKTNSLLNGSITARGKSEMANRMKLDQMVGS